METIWNDGAASEDATERAVRRETMRCDATRMIRRATPQTSTRARVAMPRARDLEAYGEELARACDAGASTARARARGDDEGAATTRACVAACARLDAEAAKGATRARRRVARATTTDSD